MYNYLLYLYSMYNYLLVFRPFLMTQFDAQLKSINTWPDNLL